ncbi:MAG: cysteine desulfurase family protein [Thermoguttaceae bacterium]
MQDVIYLDNNATTRLDEGVLEAMLPYMRGQFGNPASQHVLGRRAADAVERARQSVAALIGARRGRIVFTASATEANNLAIAGTMGGAGRPCHLVTTLVEHKSVLEPVRQQERGGAIRVTRLRPDPLGQIDPDTLAAALDDDTRLVSIIAASHVIHTVSPLVELAQVCRARDVLFHCDATQWVGRMPLDVERLGLDAVTFSAHKLYGPKGAGALYLGPRALRAGIVPQLLGGGQEQGLRAGTLNVPAIVGFGAACELAAARLQDDMATLAALAGMLLEGITSRLDGVTLNGHPQQRIPGGLHLTLRGVDSKGLMAGVPEVAFSEGSACESQGDPDYVLQAIGRPEAAHHSIRCQIGRSTTPTEVQTAVQLLVAGAERMRAFAL